MAHCINFNGTWHLPWLLCCLSSDLPSVLSYGEVNVEVLQDDPKMHHISKSESLKAYLFIVRYVSMNNIYSFVYI